MFAALLTKITGKLVADHDLIAAIVQKDQRSLETLYDRHSKLLYTLIFRIVRSATEAEDILQEVFLQVWQKASLFSDLRGSLQTWLVTLARNRALDRIRSKWQRQQMLQSPEDAMLALADQTSRANPLLNLEEEEAARIVRSALKKLTKTQRDIIMLAYYDGLSQSEIAEKLGTPIGTVKTRMRRALTILRDSIGHSR